MKLDVVFQETKCTFDAEFSRVQTASDGGYERGYAAGYDKGKQDATPSIEALTVTENGTYTAPDGVDGYSPVTVNVPIPDGYIVPNGELEITENGTHSVTEYESVNVDVPIPDGYIVPSGSQEITANGSYDVTDKAGVVVSVPEREIALQDKAITANGTYSADDGYDGLGEINVNVPIPDGYIQPSGILEITDNGSHDVTEYASVNVSVAGSGGDDGFAKEFIEGNLVDLNRSDITKVANSAFRNYYGLKTVNLPNCKTVGSFSFSVSNALVSVNIPSCDKISNNAFRESSNLVSVHFGAAYVESAAFNGCPKLESVSPILSTKLDSFTFYNCYALKFVDLLACSSIESSCFNNCKALVALVIRTSNAVCTLRGTDVFDGSKIKNGTGYIYVPLALKNQYEQATNWTVYATQFRALEEYTLDGTINGELDFAKMGVTL